MQSFFPHVRTYARTPGSITVSFYVRPHTHTHSFHPVLPHRCSSPPPSSYLLSGLFLWRFGLVSYQTDESGSQERSLCPAGWRRWVFLHEQHVLKWLSKGNKFMSLLTCCCPVCFVFFMHLVVLKLLHSVHVGVAADHQVSPPFSVFLLYLFYLFYCVAYLAQPLDCSDFNSDISLFRLASLQ